MPAWTIAMSACVGDIQLVGVWTGPGAWTHHKVVVAAVPMVLEVAIYVPYANVVENCEADSMRIAKRLLSSMVP